MYEVLIWKVGNDLNLTRLRLSVFLFFKKSLFEQAQTDFSFDFCLWQRSQLGNRQILKNAKLRLYVFLFFKKFLFEQAQTDFSFDFCLWQRSLLGNPQVLKNAKLCLSVFLFFKKFLFEQAQTDFLKNKNPTLPSGVLRSCGERGIRTPGTVSRTHV